MKFFIQKIFDGESDELVHLQFQKFSRGNFKNRAMIRAKNSKGKYDVSTSSEFANELVRAVAEKSLNQNISVTGVIVSTSDLTGKLKFQNKKQFMGVKQYVIKDEMAGKEIVEICDKFPECFLGLSFSVGESELKIKAKAPKSAKPSTKSSDEKPKVEFCKIKTRDIGIIKSLLFDVSEFKQAEVDHEFVIEDIEIPKDIKDLNEMRRLAKRKGKIIRNLVIDGKSIVEQKNFVA